MQGADWIAVLRRIPANLHDQLSLGLVTGAEIVIQQLIRMESDFLIVRGRMSGSTAEGRVLMVPYSYLTLVALNKHMSEDAVQSLFGSPAPAEVGVTSPTEVAPNHAMPAPVPAPGPRTAPQAFEAPVPPLPLVNRNSETLAGQKPAAPPSKSILLARLRERLAEKTR